MTVPSPPSLALPELQLDEFPDLLPTRLKRSWTQFVKLAGQSLVPFGFGSGPAPILFLSFIRAPESIWTTLGGELN